MLRVLDVRSMISRPNVWFSKPRSISQSLLILLALARVAKKRSFTGSEVSVKAAVSSSESKKFAFKALRRACFCSTWRRWIMS